MIPAFFHKVGKSPHEKTSSRVSRLKRQGPNHHSTPFKLFYCRISPGLKSKERQSIYWLEEGEMLPGICNYAAHMHTKLFISQPKSWYFCITKHTHTPATKNPTHWLHFPTEHLVFLTYGVKGADPWRDQEDGIKHGKFHWLAVRTRGMWTPPELLSASRLKWALIKWNMDLWRLKIGICCLK